MRCVSLSCGIRVVQRCCSNFVFDDALRRNAFFFFSLLLLRCRFFSNYDVRRAVDERAGVQIRSVPAELKTFVTTRNACTKKKKKKKKTRCVVSSRLKDDDDDEKKKKKSGR